MRDDPAGYYAELGLEPTAAPDAITAAFRRKARLLHPDVPGTGNAAAFVRMKQAYDVLGNPLRRAAYDRSARADEHRETEIPAAPEPVAERIGPRFADLPIGWLAGLGGVFCLAAVMAVIQLSRPPARPQDSLLRPAAPLTPPSIAAGARPPALPTSGVTTHYVLPSGSEAIVWQHDLKQDTFTPSGRLPDFSAVLVTGFVPGHGLVQIRLADGSNAYLDAARLAPGDRMIARRAYCAYNAGAPPHNGEVLGRHGGGPGQLAISNRSGEPVVVKLRDATGRTAITVFVAAGRATAIEGLPDGVYRPDFAAGELWSRTCGAFTAGMRAQRFLGYASLAGLSPLVIPPEDSVAPPPVDITDQAFQQD